MSHDLSLLLIFAQEEKTNKLENQRRHVFNIFLTQITADTRFMCVSLIIVQIHHYFTCQLANIGSVSAKINRLLTRYTELASAVNNVASAERSCSRRLVTDRLTRRIIYSPNRRENPRGSGELQALRNSERKCRTSPFDQQPAGRSTIDLHFSAGEQ